MPFPKPLDCSDAGRREVLLALLHRELVEEDEDTVLAHLRACPHCLSEMAVVLSETDLEEIARWRDRQ